MDKKASNKKYLKAIDIVQSNMDLGENKKGMCIEFDDFRLCIGSTALFLFTYVKLEKKEKKKKDRRNMLP